MTSPNLSQNAKAILWVTLGTALFTIIYASGKMAHGIADPFQVIFLRYVSGFSTLIVVSFLFGDGLFSYRSKKPASHLLRAIFGCYGGAAIIHASAQMPILDATAISLLYVIFIVALGVVLLKERITRMHWLAIGVSSAGAAIVMGAQGAFQSFDPAYLWPAAIALIGALLIAFEAILIRTLSQSEKTLTVLLHVNFFGLFLVAIPAFSAWQSINLTETLLILMLGPIAISAQFCVIRGYRIADVSIVGPVDYTWLLFAGLLGFLFFGEVPSGGVLFGAALIALGGVLLALVKSR